MLGYIFIYLNFFYFIIWGKNILSKYERVIGKIFFLNYSNKIVYIKILNMSFMIMEYVMNVFKNFVIDGWIWFFFIYKICIIIYIIVYLFLSVIWYFYLYFRNYFS